jgi:hypothetical protein
MKSCSSSEPLCLRYSRSDVNTYPQRILIGSQNQKSMGEKLGIIELNQSLKTKELWLPPAIMEFANRTQDAPSRVTMCNILGFSLCLAQEC